LGVRVAPASQGSNPFPALGKRTQGTGEVPKAGERPAHLAIIRNNAVSLAGAFELPLTDYKAPARILTITPQ